jgi:hypothetical protein
MHSRFMATEVRWAHVLAVSNTYRSHQHTGAKLSEDIGQVFSITLTSPPLIPLLLMPASGTFYAMSLLYVVHGLYVLYHEHMR